MEPTFNWAIDIWGKFSLWASTQPTFVEVAIGMGLFYVVLQIVKALYKFIVFILSGLFSGRPRFRRKKDLRPQSQFKPVSIDDEAPPFIFR
jgi:hypothetical protein